MYRNESTTHRPLRSTVHPLFALFLVGSFLLSLTAVAPIHAQETASTDADLLESMTALRESITPEQQAQLQAVLAEYAERFEETADQEIGNPMPPLLQDHVIYVPVVVNDASAAQASLAEEVTVVTLEDFNAKQDEIWNDLTNDIAPILTDEQMEVHQMVMDTMSELSDASLAAITDANDAQIQQRQISAYGCYVASYYAATTRTASIAMYGHAYINYVYFAGGFSDVNQDYTILLLSDDTKEQALIGLQNLSAATMLLYANYVGTDTDIRANEGIKGVTQAGSSAANALVLITTDNFYEVRTGLWATAVIERSNLSLQYTENCR